MAVVAEAIKTAREKVVDEITRLDAILARRGQFYEDEDVERRVYGMVLRWMDEEKAERDAIDAAIMEATRADKTPPVVKAEREYNDVFFDKHGNRRMRR